MTGADLVVEGGTLVGSSERPDRDVVISDGRVVSRLPADRDLRALRIDARGCLVAPGLVDLQVNGAADADLVAHPDRWPTVAAVLADHGTTAFCPTLVTAAAPTLCDALAVFDEARLGNHPLAPMLCGAHLEGPFLAPTRAGAHDRAELRTPDVAEIERWLASAVALVTLAPELPGALDAVTRLRRAGVTVSLGHSEATAEVALAALDAGATAVTHLFNAMVPFHHRSPGLIGVVLTDPRSSVTLIADGAHLDPLAVRLAWDALGPNRRCLISDQTATTLGGRPVGRRGTTIRTTDGLLAGSARTLLEAVRWIVEHGIAPVEEAWRAASATPAALIGRHDLGHLEPGARGDLVVLGSDLNPRVTVVCGRVVAGEGALAR